MKRGETATDILLNRLFNTNPQSVGANSSSLPLFKQGNKRVIKDEHFNELKQKYTENEWNEKCKNVLASNLSGNLIHHFPSSMFPNLKELDLSFNDINEYDVELGPSLVKLNISHNNIHTSSVEAFAFNENNQLEYLDISYNNLNYVPVSMCMNLNNLKYLNISHNDMNKSKKKGITKLINFHKNYYTLFPFSNMVDIDKKKVAFINSLQHLIVCNCNLQPFPENLSAFVNLQELDLSDNPIGNIGCLPEISFHHLRSLKMNNCCLDQFPLNILKYASNIKEIDLSNNNITFLTLSDDIPLSKLKRFEIANNKLKSKDCSLLEAWFKRGSNNVPSNLTVLNLSGNPGLSYLMIYGDFSLEACTDMRTLLLKGMNLTSLPSTIETLSRLEILDVSCNYLKRLPSYLFINHPNMLRIDLSFNSLADFTLLNTEKPDVYSGWANLRELNLSGNKFKTFPSHLILHLPSIKTIDMSYNQMDIIIDKHVDAWKLQNKIEIYTILSKPDLIIDRLYLGNAFAARSSHYLKKLGVTHILTVAKNVPPYTSTHANRFKYLLVDVEDIEEEKLSKHFEQCHRFIDAGIVSGGILVHCKAGISRSATIVISYVMARRNMTLDEAIEHTRAKRPVICPNSSFIEQLKQFELTLQK